MLAYTVQLKGRKDPVKFNLPDDTLLKQYHEYLSTGANPIGSYIGTDARKAVLDFREVQLMDTRPAPQAQIVHLGHS
ncbi:MAG: hypothetical protein HY000_01055 [Planctomycetes bacterium]|nr:hypothetical protein [Planctomycetota bacterium]